MGSVSGNEPQVPRQSSPVALKHKTQATTHEVLSNPVPSQSPLLLLQALPARPHESAGVQLPMPGGGTLHLGVVQALGCTVYCLGSRNLGCRIEDLASLAHEPKTEKRQINQNSASAQRIQYPQVLYIYIYLYLYLYVYLYLYIDTYVCMHIQRNV